ncbi:hypothetical protein [Adhaeribacter terreus]|uniref:DUF4351 domain-containing protein n=1 Tax=Adhaeribacter terreus TaxID=529703 RepID=A0ABW0ECI6_9BACT
MEIIDKTEILALHKVLAKVKFSAEIDSYDLNELANSPIITRLLVRAREELIKNLKEEGHETLVENWLKNTAFKFEGETGRAIVKRLQHLSDSSKSNLADLGKDELKEFATELIEPLVFEEEEADKLANYISEMVKPKKS